MIEHPEHSERAALHQRQAREPEHVEPVVGAPDAVKEAALGHENAKAALAKARGRGVEWVRPSDLIARQSSRLARGGIDFHAELARRARTVTGVEKLSQRVRRLPPVSAFGRRGADQSTPARAGIDMR